MLLKSSLCFVRLLICRWQGVAYPSGATAGYGMFRQLSQSRDVCGEFTLSYGSECNKQERERLHGGW